MVKSELSGVPTAPEVPEVIRVEPQPDLAVGAVIAGRYEIRGRLGAGGMGAVYRAHDRELQEDVALKVVLPERLEDAFAVERLRREVKLARQITHPNVCRVFDLGESDGLYFLTMELVEGRTLRTLLAEGPLPPEQALDVLAQIAQALNAAHAQGIVHRDLKPENVLVRSDGRAVVADFGLAHRPHVGGTTAGREGTPGYMSPEQFRGEPVDMRTDVFALGVVGFELLTGRRPFEGRAPEAAGTAQVDSLRVSMPPDLAEPVWTALREVFARALSARAEERFRSAAEFSTALAQAREADQVHEPLQDVSQADAAPLPSRSRRFRRILGSGLVAAVLGLSLLVMMGLRWWTPPPPPPVWNPPAARASKGRISIAVLPFENTTQDAVWRDVSGNAAEAIRAGLRSMPEVRLADRPAEGKIEARAQGIAFFIRGSVQRFGAGPRLLAHIELIDEVGDPPPNEPVEVDAHPERLSEALDLLRRRVLDEARLAVRHYSKRRWAIEGTHSEPARAKLLQYYQMVGSALRSEHFEGGLKLIDEALAADGRYAPALVERAYLRAYGAGGGPSAEQIADALANIDLAGTIRPDDSEVAVARCRLLQFSAEADSNPTDTAIHSAMDACQAALSVAPVSPHVHVTLARLNDRLCQDDNAMRMLERAVELDRSLSGRALKHLTNLALLNDRLLVAELVSEQLVAFQEDARRLGPRALGRRAGAPEVAGVYLTRAVVLLRLGRLDGAKVAFERELAEIVASKGDAWSEAAAIRGLQRVALAEHAALTPDLTRRLAAIERDVMARLATDPAGVENLTKAYGFVDPVAALPWLGRLKAPASCDESFYRSSIYHAAGRDDLARKALDACSPAQQWEKNCAAQYSSRVSR